jgi:hypothetical protein
MTTKKPSLAAALHEASGKKAPPHVPAVQEPAAGETGKAARPSRQQTKLIGGHFDPIVSRQLRQLALDENSTVQALLAEALNDLFLKYGKKPLA